jgi:drug/metabolite transporter (DMT)-like permease
MFLLSSSNLSSVCWGICWSLLYAFFWVIPRRLEFKCRRFGTLCLFHLHRQVDVSRMKLGIRNGTGKSLAWSSMSHLMLLRAKPFPVPFLIPSFILLTSTCLWRWNRQSVPKRQHLNSRCRVITQKKAYNMLLLRNVEYSMEHSGNSNVRNFNNPLTRTCKQPKRD